MSFVENVNKLATDLTSQVRVNLDTIVSNLNSINTVATDMDNINSVVLDLSNVDAVAADLTNIDTVSSNINNVNTVSSNIADVDTVADNILDVTSIVDNIVPNLPEILQADINAGIATTKASESQLHAWESEASRMTSDSYATEPEDVFVKVYTSNADGTFTATDTTEYSSFHWKQKAEELVVAELIDDITPSTVRVYSSIKTQELHDAQASTIAALATAQAQISNATTPAFASIPKYPLTGILDMAIVVPSTNTTIFEVDDVNNLFKFYIDASYTFLSTIVIKSNVSAARDVTFTLIDDSTNDVIKTITTSKIIASGTTESFPMSTLLTVGVNGIPTSPLNIRVEVSCSDTGYELRSFSSIVASSSGYGSENVTSIDAALGLIYEGLV